MSFKAITIKIEKEDIRYVADCKDCMSDRF